MVLIHHYETDADGLIRKANLIVGTNHNHAPIQLSVKRAAQALLKGISDPAEPLLNQIEMAFRAYDPCLACATHALPGRLPLSVCLYGPQKNLRRRITRLHDGRVSDETLGGGA